MAGHWSDESVSEVLTLAVTGTASAGDSGALPSYTRGTAAQSSGHLTSQHLKHDGHLVRHNSDDKRITA